MADTYYAWTNIKTHDGKEHSETAVGDKVSASSLGLDDKQFQQLVDARSVRSSMPPKVPENYAGSPRDFVLEQRAKQLQDIEDEFTLGGEDNEEYEVPSDESISATLDPPVPPEPAFTHSQKTIDANKNVEGSPGSPPKANQ